MENDLISRSDLLKPDEESDKLLILGGGPHSGKTISIAEQLMKRKIEAAAAVDAVEVVRCRDCKSFAVHERSGNGYCNHNNGIAIPEPVDFCSYGERKEDGV